MKHISFLYSSNKNKFPKIAFLLKSGTVATVDESMNEDQITGSEKALNAIHGTKIENIVWWWPSDNAFKKIHGISAFAIINILKIFGFTQFSPDISLRHQQVQNDKNILKDYIEVVLSLSDERYQELVAQYGDLKLYKPS